MTTAEKIECIVLTVAEYYGIGWQELWKKDKKIFLQRTNLIKLMSDNLNVTDRVTLSEYTLFTYSVVTSALSRPNDFHYSRISHEIRIQLLSPKRA